MQQVRLATTEDLPVIIDMYRQVVHQMTQSGLSIWDEVYPIICLPDDILRGQMYTMFLGDQLVGAFVLSTTPKDDGQIEWLIDTDQAVYLDRLAVHPAYSRQGIARELLLQAAQIGIAQSAEALRLLVVEQNLPAIQLYEKAGFKRRGGVCLEVVDEELTLKEFGYELDLRSID